MLLWWVLITKNIWFGCIHMTMTRAKCASFDLLTHHHHDFTYVRAVRHVLCVFGLRKKIIYFDYWLWQRPEWETDGWLARWWNGAGRSGVMCSTLGVRIKGRIHVRSFVNAVRVRKKGFEFGQCHAPQPNIIFNEPHCLWRIIDSIHCDWRRVPNGPTLLWYVYTLQYVCSKNYHH